jgi:hypothetical protein
MGGKESGFRDSGAVVFDDLVLEYGQRTWAVIA